MAYVPLNMGNYLAAVAGANAGMAATSLANGKASITASVYLVQSNVAETFAETFDTLWGPTGDQFTAAAIQAATTLCMAQRDPTPGDVAEDLTATWTGIANAVAALVTSAQAVLASKGVTPPANNAVVAAVLANNATTMNSGGTIGPGTSVVWDSANFTFTAGGNGKVRMIAFATVGGAGGSAAPAGDKMLFQFRKDGALFGAGTAPTTTVELSVSHTMAFASMVWEDTETVGSTHTYGIEVTDSTTPTNTIACAQYQACISLAETL